MKSRVILGADVSQNIENGFFSANDLIRSVNEDRNKLGKCVFNLTQWLRTKSTKEFIEELQKTNKTVLIKGRGRNSVTWMHPLLFIDLVLSINPDLKIEVYSWMYYELSRYRNDDNASYNKMCGALYHRFDNKSTFHKYISKVDGYIIKECGLVDWDCANSYEIELRDKMYNNISLLCSVMPNTDSAVRIGVKEAKKQIKND